MKCVVFYALKRKCQNCKLSRKRRNAFKWAGSRGDLLTSKSSKHTRVLTAAAVHSGDGAHRLAVVVTEPDTGWGTWKDAACCGDLWVISKLSFGAWNRTEIDRRGVFVVGVSRYLTRKSSPKLNSTRSDKHPLTHSHDGPWRVIY